MAEFWHPTGSVRPAQGWSWVGAAKDLPTGPCEFRGQPAVTQASPGVHIPVHVRAVRTVRTELTDRMLIFSEGHLRRVLATYVAHYNAQRPHRALQLRPPRPQSAIREPVQGRIRRRPILGGLINQYEPAA